MMSWRRLAITLACLAVGRVASAEETRVRWRGLAVEGRAPPALQPTVASHVAVALRSLGSSLVTAAPQDAEAAASCAFPPSARVARCVVVVQVGRASGGRAERRAEIRYRDAEDLAESLALLVSDILTSEFPDVVGGTHPPPQNPPPQNPPPQNPPPQNPPSQNPPSQNPPSQNPPSQNPPPQLPPPTAPTPEQQRAHEAEMQRQLEIVKSLQRQADDARAERERHATPTPPPKRPTPAPPTQLAVELGAVGVFGLGPQNPTLVGGAARLVYSRALLRAGASLSLAGMRQTLASHDLSFFRALLAARAGVGFRSSVADFDLTAGPALLVLVDDAHSEGRHGVASLAFVGGPRLEVTLAGPIALVAGADLAVAVTDEKVVAGTARVAELSRASVEVTLGIAWRSRR